MTEEMYTIKKDCYGDYAIFKKDTICIVSDIQDKQLAETLCTQFNLLNDEREGFIEFIQHQNENIEFLEKRINSLKDDRQAYKQDWKAASAYCDSYKEEISYLKDENNGLTEEITNLRKENKELKEEYSSLQKSADHINEVAMQDREYAERLYKENKELKKQIEEYTDENKYILIKKSENSSEHVICRDCMNYTMDYEETIIFEEYETVTKEICRQGHDIFDDYADDCPDYIENTMW